MTTDDLFDADHYAVKMIWCNTLGVIDRLMGGGLHFENIKPNSSILDIDIVFKEDKFVFRISLMKHDNYFDPTLVYYVIADGVTAEIKPEFKPTMWYSRVGGNYTFQYKGKAYRAVVSGMSPPPQRCPVHAQLRELVIRVS